jgi:hypothetical protein
VWRTAAENIGDSQIVSEIPVLNRDYRKRNGDTLLSSHPFYPFIEDPRIEFCMATVDPFGNPTNGITRTHTLTSAFDVNSNANNVKRTATGGIDNWDPTRYLNVWVCNLTGGVLGYAAFPTELSFTPDLDGIVIGYKYYGTTGAAVPPYSGGRTSVHEVGHWLNLIHIWGDDTCGTDQVTDTKVAFYSNYGCPSFPHSANSARCAEDANKEMFMNYMDYVDDHCMNMFTHGQGLRMRNAIQTYRPGILTQTACTSTAAIDEQNMSMKFSVFPNPSSAGECTVYLGAGHPFDGKQVTISVRDAVGKEVYSNTYPYNIRYDLDLSFLPDGSYTVQTSCGDYKGIRKWMLLR